MMVAVRLSVSVIPRLADENLILTYDEHESYCDVAAKLSETIARCWSQSRQSLKS